MSKGWIKIERDLLDHWVFESESFLYIWIYLLLKANHEDRTILVDNKPVKVKRGSFYTSIRKISLDLNWTFAKTRRITKSLENEHMITIKCTKRGSLVTIENYSFYQGTRITDDSTDDSTDVSTHSNQTRMNKNVKKEKKPSPSDMTEEILRRWNEETEYKDYD